MNVRNGSPVLVALPRRSLDAAKAMAEAAAEGAAEAEEIAEGPALGTAAAALLEGARWEEGIPAVEAEREVKAEAVEDVE